MEHSSWFEQRHLARIWRLRLLESPRSSEQDLDPDIIVPLLVDIGATQDAANLVTTLSDESQQVKLFIAIAQSLNPGERHVLLERVEQIAHGIDDPEDREDMLVLVAAEWMDVQAWAQAEHTIRSISPPFLQALALRDLACAQLRAGKWAVAHSLAHETLEMAQSIVPPSSSDTLIAEVILMFLETNAWSEAEEVAKTISDPSRRVQTLQELIQDLAEFGDHESAHRLLLEAEAVALTIRYPPDGARHLMALAQALAQLGDGAAALRLLHEAEAAALTIVDANEKARRCEEIARLFAAWGAMAEAERIARSFADSASQAVILSMIAVYVAQAGDDGAAHRMLKEVEHTALSITKDFTQSQTLRQIALTWLQLGAVGEAERIAWSISDGRQQAETLRGMSVRLAQAGDWAEAERITRSITVAYSQAWAFAELAALVPGKLADAVYPFLYQMLPLNEMLHHRDRESLANHIARTLATLPVTPQLIAFIQAAWIQAMTCDDLLAVLPFARPLIRANPAFAMQLSEAMREWMTA